MPGLFDTGCSLPSMSIPDAPGMPTIADVLAELRLQRMESRTEVAEVRGLISELRADLATSRVDLYGRLDDIRHRLDTLFDELAAFRRDYNGHTHEMMATRRINMQGIVRD